MMEKIQIPKNKYGACKAVVDDIVFDSRKEARRYCELKLLERAGQITDLQLQVPYELIPAQKIDKKTVEKACSYVADFVYRENGETVVEDAKGVRTDVYRIKRKLMLYKYGIQIKEV